MVFSFSTNVAYIFEECNLTILISALRSLQLTTTKKKDGLCRPSAYIILRPFSS
ncbi:hypothetical protein ANACAC_03168 [Anaerostipes caccae L1-92]|uniref:Uncharacterized protein n=1 Tax=Anaerostipes caccae (strain DSM 14662 / CCUG 47493 / JCM 13470 / NCIMB 13811 / L1-92) TaxID=411490 RepID=B0MGT1_ANACD|nr:hypothetical protein ANACAC_03168 [Anaerostipes caccae L1-92]